MSVSHVDIIDFDAAGQALRDGQASQAVQRFAALHRGNPTDPRVLQGATDALCHLARAEGTTDILEGDGAADLVRALIVQTAASGQPRILHEGLAGLMTPRSREAARRLIATLLPVVDELLADPAPAPGLALLLAIARSVMPRGGPSQGEISRIHLAGFPDFTVADFAVPYSVLLRPGYYGANKADLLARFPDPNAALDPAAGLGLRHLRLLDQLGVSPLFDADAQDALAEAIATRLGKARDNPEEIGAARSLVLRYLHRPNGAAAGKLLALGLDRAVLEAAGQWPRAEVGSRARIPDLDGRASKLRAAAINALRMAAPRLAPHRRKARVALCVSGQLRGHEQAFESWKRALLPSAEFDIYVHTWKDVGRSSPKPGRKTLPFEGTAFCREWLP